MTIETLSPEVIASLTITGGLAFLMVWVARRKDMLEERHASKRCPSCGRFIGRNGSCGCPR